MEACEESVREGYGGVLEDLEVLAVGSLTPHLRMEIFDSATPQSLQDVYTALGIY